jgi:FAD/FMN-containing dehydrogenase
MWRAIEDFPIASNDRQGENWIRLLPWVGTLSILVPPADVLSVIEVVKKAAVPEVYGAAIVGRLGIGHILTRLWTINEEAPHSPHLRVIHELSERLASAATIVQLGAVNPWPTAPPHLASMRAVKQALDPKNILRGREIF